MDSRTLKGEALKAFEPIQANCFKGDNIRERCKRNKLVSKQSIAIIDAAWNKSKATIDAGRTRYVPNSHNNANTALRVGFGFAKVVAKRRDERGIWIS